MRRTLRAFFVGLLTLGSAGWVASCAQLQKSGDSQTRPASARSEVGTNAKTAKRAQPSAWRTATVASAATARDADVTVSKQTVSRPAEVNAHIGDAPGAGSATSAPLAASQTRTGASDSASAGASAPMAPERSRNTRTGWGWLGLLGLLGLGGFFHPNSRRDPAGERPAAPVDRRVRVYP
jgi:hypothetical protein